jgi:L-lactate dehydrogenase complex protein LldG
MIDSADQRALGASFPGIRFDVTRETAAQAKVGISQMDWALADTGTLVQVPTRWISGWSQPSRRFTLHWFPLHPFCRICPPCFPSWNLRKLAYLAFITGPSRTADIERVLTIGVHGPEPTGHRNGG